MFQSRVFIPPCNLSDAFYIRAEVFTKEQGFSDPDSDELDDCATHIVIYHDGQPAATGRVYCDRDGATFHLGRIAVLKEFRGCRLGRDVMEELEKIARRHGAKLLVVGAQLYAVPFYEKCGFISTGERYMDEFCEHEFPHKRLV